MFSWDEGLTESDLDKNCESEYLCDRLTTLKIVYTLGFIFMTGLLFAFSVIMGTVCHYHGPRTLLNHWKDIPSHQSLPSREMSERLKAYRELAKDMAISNESICGICIEDFKPEDDVIRLPCNGEHVFHFLCINEWFEKSKKNTCPLCR